MPRNESCSRSAGKRPMRAMTPQEKMDAIGRVHTGESKAAVARDIGVPESTLRGWCKAEEKIRSQLNNVRGTGSYEHILTSSSAENSDNSLPGSSSRSTPTQNAMVLASGAAEKVSEEHECGPAPKRAKMENNNLTSAAAAAAININNMSTSARTSTIGNDALYNPYFYNLLTSDPNKTVALLNSIMKGESLIPFTGYPSSVANFIIDNIQQMHRNNGAIANMTMANTLPTMLVNGKKKYNNALALTSSMEVPARVAARRPNSQSPNAEKPSGSISQLTNDQTSPMPSTSANNGGVTTNISTKSPKETKKLSAIICQLQQQQGTIQDASTPVQDISTPVQDDGTPVQDANTPVQDTSTPVQECNMGEVISNNAINNNNNNVDHVDNETTNRRSPDLPPEFDDMLKYCTKLIDWLQKYGTPICTFQQVMHIRTVLDNMTNWANSKEIEPKKKTNGTS